LAGWLMAVLSAGAAMKANPYATIALHNPFGLRDIVVEPAPPVAELPRPRLDVKLTCVTTLLSAPKVAFRFEEAQTKKVEYSPLLGEGETFNAFTVVSIAPEKVR